MSYDPVICAVLYSRALQNYINQNHLQNKDAIHTRLKNFQTLLSGASYYCQIECTLSEIICIKCQKGCTDQRINLPCGQDSLCSAECVRQLVQDCTGGNLLQWNCVLCNCGIGLQIQLIQWAYGGRQQFKKLLKQEQKKNEPMFTCDIHYGQVKISDMVTLNCNHRFCTQCVQMQLTYYINQGQVSDKILSCPNCETPIEPSIIQALMSSELFQKLQRFRLRQLINEEKNSFVFTCNKCEFMAILNDDIDQFRCRGCGIQVCPKCQNVPHIGSTCQEYQKWLRQNGEVDQEFEKIMKAGNMFICPWCGEAIEKTGGCKYMACQTAQCKGKNYFCVDCMTKLTSRHQIHECPTPDVFTNRIKKCNIF